MRERSRRKPVDEEDTKLGRWVSHIASNELRATVLWIYICIMRYSFWDTIFGYTSTIYRISFILLHMYFTLCFASLALLYHVIELCTRHWTFVHSSEQVFFFLFVSFVFALSRPSRSHFTSSSRRDNLIRFKCASQGFLLHHLHDSASAFTIRPRIIAPRATNGTISWCDDGGRVAILNVRE